jgi:branched-chain amino acid transport system ATP-binding protein
VHRIAAAGIGYVPQGRRIFPSLNVHEHLKMVARRGSDWSPDRIYDLWPRLAERRKVGAGSVSPRRPRRHKEPRETDRRPLDAGAR